MTPKLAIYHYNMSLILNRLQNNPLLFLYLIGVGNFKL
jgi:hypothetical protein